MRLAWGFLLAALSPGAALACALELILAVDVSGSINVDEFALQTEGTASAFEDPQLAEAIINQPGGVWVTYTQWSGATRQRQVTGWHHLTDPGSMAEFATAIRRGGRVWRNYSTAIGEALFHVMKVGETAPARCKRRVVDVSGDGVSNEGRAPMSMARTLEGLGYTINALVIRGDSPDPVRYYRNNVLAGPGAFMEVAEDFADYPRAIRKKLLREVESQALLSDAGGAPTETLQ